MNCLEVALFCYIFIQNKYMLKHHLWQSPTQNYNVCDSGLRRVATKTFPSRKSRICTLFLLGFFQYDPSEFQRLQAKRAMLHNIPAPPKNPKPAPPKTPKENQTLQIIKKARSLLRRSCNTLYLCAH